MRRGKRRQECMKTEKDEGIHLSSGTNGEENKPKMKGSKNLPVIKKTKEEEKKGD